MPLSAILDSNTDIMNERDLKALKVAMQTISDMVDRLGGKVVTRIAPTIEAVMDKSRALDSSDLEILKKEIGIMLDAKIAFLENED